MAKKCKHHSHAASFAYCQRRCGVRVALVLSSLCVLMDVQASLKPCHALQARRRLLSHFPAPNLGARPFVGLLAALKAPDHTLSAPPRATPPPSAALPARDTRLQATAAGHTISSSNATSHADTASKASDHAVNTQPWPPEFDPDAYMDYNPQFKEAITQRAAQQQQEELLSDQELGWSSPEQPDALLPPPPPPPLAHAAWQHYLEEGSKQAEVLCARVPVVMSHTTHTGITNRIFSLVTAWTLAARLGSDVLLDDLQLRNSFTKEAMEHHGHNWPHVSFASMFDLERTVDMLTGVGVTATAVPEALHRHDHDHDSPAHHFVAWLESMVAAAQKRSSRAGLPPGHPVPAVLEVPWFFPDSPHQSEYKALRPSIEKAVLTAVRQHLKAHGRGVQGMLACSRLPGVHLRIKGNPLFRLRLWDQPVSYYLEHNLRFAPLLEAAADAIIAAMARAGVSRWDAVHLRLEGDITDVWSVTHRDGVDGIIRDYVARGLQLGMGDGTCVLTASGLFTYGEGPGLWAGKVVPAYRDITAAARAPLLHKELFSCIVGQRGAQGDGIDASGADAGGVGNGTVQCTGPYAFPEAATAAAADAARVGAAPRAAKRRRGLLGAGGSVPPARTVLVGQPPSGNATGAGAAAAAVGGAAAGAGHALGLAGTSNHLAAALGVVAEQCAAIDALLMERARLFVGYAPSTMSRFVLHRRLLNGLSRNTSVLLGWENKPDAW